MHLKTTVTLVIAGNKLTKSTILFDKVISTETVKELDISPYHPIVQHIFCWHHLAAHLDHMHQKLAVATAEIKTITREQISMSVLIVPTISAPIQMLFSYLLPHLSGLTAS